MIIGSLRAAVRKGQQPPWIVSDELWARGTSRASKLAPSAGSVWPSPISGSTSRQRPAGPSQTSAITWSTSQPSKAQDILTARRGAPTREHKPHYSKHAYVLRGVLDRIDIYTQLGSG